MSPAADAIFRLANTGGARLVVPAIVVAELFFITRRMGHPIAPSDLLAEIATSREFVLSDLGRRQLESIGDIVGVSEIHDLLIVAEALVRQVPLVSRDADLRQTGAIEVIW